MSKNAFNIFLNTTNKEVKLDGAVKFLIESSMPISKRSS